MKNEIRGMLLTHAGDLYLITHDNYGLIRLPLKDYNPDTMDFKLLINPLFRTAVYSDDRNIYAVAMDDDHNVVARYQRAMFHGKEQIPDRIFKALFPFHIETVDHTSGYAPFRVLWNGPSAWIGIALALVLGCAVMLFRRISLGRNWPDLALLLCTGVYGLIIVNLIEPEER